ncbi:NAD(P)/FAD-dependent oxidoreductase [Lentzea sp. BCCO 10_0856]|uniref:NADH:ubiquinone reductase (non-electrogenic) n=1 Tax=Lentzea miocenica TaxID=3095431 RepID=A0ABU4SS42_9PSEU|nr:NAD(P)/FAD-dependent oxidoreductase [Lentzea sp. BCCO 10_0856]MDX8028701.1 NAD(P)/FAD-dependent oxidoreductase [Lentzea sp. BCCO 10_0856]
MGKHRVVVVGGGFGGLGVVRGLKRADVEVTLIDRTNHHLFQPLLYQVATALLPAGDIAPAFRAILRKQRNARVLLGEVTGFDTKAKRVHVDLPDGTTKNVEYDTLVVAAGSRDSYFGHDDWAESAPPMKTLEQAVDLRSKLLRAFETAAVADDPKQWLSFAVVGAGPTGVELAGQLADLARRALKGQFREIDPRDIRITLLDAVPHVLPPFSAPLREHARVKLERLGVTVMTNAMVESIDEEGLTTRDGDRVEARTIIWAAGVQASPLARKLAEATETDVDRKGRILVNPADCSVARDVYAIGDMVNLKDLPGIAEPALQEGHHVARVIKARLQGRETKPFRYLDLGTMATISPGDAVADIKKLRLKGIIGKAAWLVVHIAFLVGWRNRIAVLTQWGWNLVTGRRTQPIILEPMHAIER